MPLENGKATGHISTSRYLRDRMHFGKLWQIYIPVIIFDLLQSSVCLKGSCNHGTPKTIIDVIVMLPKLASEKHPCRSSAFLISGGEWGGLTFFDYTYNSTHFPRAASRICGLFNVTFTPAPYATELKTQPTFHSAEKPLALSWNLKTQQPFGINCTLSDLVAPNSHGCADAKVKINISYNRQQHRTHTMCPNWGRRSFFGENIIVKLFLKYYMPAFTEDGKVKYFTGISFHYQILDYTDFSLISYSLAKQQANVGNLYIAKQHSNEGNLTYSLVMHLVSDAFPKPNGKNAPLIYAARVPNALVYAYSFSVRDRLYASCASR